MDLVPYFQKASSFDEIIRWIPALSHEEIAVAEQFYQEHKEELDEKDRRLRQQREEQIRLQRLRFPAMAGTTQERAAHLRDLLDKRRQERNGERHPG